MTHQKEFSRFKRPNESRPIGSIYPDAYVEDQQSGSWVTWPDEVWVLWFGVKPDWSVQLGDEIALVAKFICPLQVPHRQAIGGAREELEMRWPIHPLALMMVSFMFVPRSGRWKVISVYFRKSSVRSFGFSMQIYTIQIRWVAIRESEMATLIYKHNLHSNHWVLPLRPAVTTSKWNRLMKQSYGKRQIDIEPAIAWLSTASKAIGMAETWYNQGKRMDTNNQND